MKNRLKEIREMKGYSMSALARASGVCRATIHKIEHGDKQTRNVRTMQKIAHTLGVPVNSIFQIEEW